MLDFPTYGAENADTVGSLDIFTTSVFDRITDFDTSQDRLLIDGDLFGGMAAPIVYMSTDGEDIDGNDNILINIGQNWDDIGTASIGGIHGTGWLGQFVTDPVSIADIDPSTGDHPGLVFVISDQLLGDGTYATEIWYISNLDALDLVGGSFAGIEVWAAPVAVITNITSVAQLATFTEANFDFSYDSSVFEAAVDKNYTAIVDYTV